MGRDVSEALIDRDALPDGELVALDADAGDGSMPLLVLRRGERVQAWHNACPHAGRRLDYAPGRFLVHDGRLVCAAHGAQFDLDSGRCIDGPGRGGALAPLAVTAVDGGWRVLLR